MVIIQSNEKYNSIMQIRATLKTCHGLDDSPINKQGKGFFFRFLAVFVKSISDCLFSYSRYSLSSITLVVTSKNENI